MSSRQTNVLHLAQHLLAIGRQEAALDALEKASSDEIESTEYWAIRAEALADLGQYDASAESVRCGLERDPEDIQLLDALAIAEVERGFPGKAEKALAKALELSPQNPLLLAHRAYVLARRGEFDESRTAIAEAMEVAPEWKPVLQTRAQVAVLANDKHASEYIDDLLRLDPNDRIAHALRGNLASEQKRFVSASRAFDEAVRLDPSDAELAEVAREARVAAHPVLAPVRAMWLFGRWRSYFLYLGLVSVLAASGLESIRVVVVIIWLVIVALSWFGPALIRRYQNRKFGGF
jgi:Flp pilus assembly protein TadD